MLIMKTWNRLDLQLLLVVLTVGECGSSTVVGRTGQNITLSCKYDIKSNGELSICWNRGEISTSGCNNQLIATGGYKVNKETNVSSRYQLLGRLDEGDVSLTILNLIEADAGRYGCRVEIPGWFNDQKHHFDLTIEKVVITRTAATAEPAGSDVIVCTGSDVRPIAAMMAENQIVSSQSPVHQEGNSLHIFIGHTLRLSFIIFIPAVLLSAGYNVTRSWRSKVRRSIRAEEYSHV